MRCLLILLAALLIGDVNAASQESGDHKAVTQKDQKAEQKKTATNNETVLIEKPNSDAVKDASNKPDTHADEKLNIDRQITEYTRQLAIYTKELSKYTSDVSDFTFYLVIATIVLGFIGAYQGWKLRDTVELAREEFIASHKPKLIVRRFELYPREGERGPWVEFVVANVGQTEATIISSNITTQIRTKAEMGTLEKGFIAPYQPTKDILANMTFQPAERRPFNFYFHVIDEASVIEDVRTGRAGLVCFGFIRYKDSLGGEQETRFYRTYKVGERFFDAKKDDPDYEDS